MQLKGDFYACSTPPFNSLTMKFLRPVYAALNQKHCLNRCIGYYFRVRFAKLTPLTSSCVAYDVNCGDAAVTFRAKQVSAFLQRNFFLDLMWTITSRSLRHWDSLYNICAFCLFLK